MSDAAAFEARLLRGSKLLLGANGLLWIVLGLWWLARPPGGSGSTPDPAALLAALMFGNAAILIVLALRLVASGGWMLRLAFIWVGVNLVLSFTDEVGLADLIVGALNAVTLLLLALLLHAHRRPSP